MNLSATLLPSAPLSMGVIRYLEDRVGQNVYKTNMRESGEDLDWFKPSGE
jgi:hypothetical protein